MKGSVNVPLDQLKVVIENLKSKNKPIITCCASGGRSGVAKRMLKSSELEAYNGGSWGDVKK